MSTLLAQIDTLAASAANPNVPQGQELNLFDLMVKGGPIMIPIALLSLWSIYIMIERYLHIKKATKIDAQFVAGVNANLVSGNISAAKTLCASQGEASLARVIGAGVHSIGQPVADIESSLETVANMEIKELEKNMEYLGVIAGVAPMLGFIGTIAGIIKIFYDIAQTENISISIIAGGLYQKMLTSGAGLAVGIMAYAAYHLLNMMIDRFSLNLERNVFEFVKTIKSPAGK
ncbi:MAG TPA: MotA/TolQ/ExbB proton channel family protein [Luteibaculaceae bacterium]|nr:MotA/TolQ/ExbB proton channel family protein [Luteibaculaceae bacterium]